MSPYDLIPRWTAMIITVSSSVELEHAIQQLSKNNLSTMTFKGVAKAPWSMANNTATYRAADEADNHRTTTSTSGIIPSDLRHLCKVEYPTIRFNPSRAAAGLVLDDEGRTVTQTVGTAGHKCVYATENFSTGCHYWSFRIKHRTVNSNIMFGVGNGQSSVTASVFPGCPSDASGCSLDLVNGHFCRAGTRLVTPAHKHLTQATKIGVLLDLYHRAISFYADGNLVGTGAGSDVLTANMYYPVIAICELDHSVTIEDNETN